jgi:hypothetical protein
MLFLVFPTLTLPIIQTVTLCDGPSRIAFYSNISGEMAVVFYYGMEQPMRNSFLILTRIADKGRWGRDVDSEQ